MATNWLAISYMPTVSATFIGAEAANERRLRRSISHDLRSIAVGAWRADCREQRAFAVHPFEGADYLVVVFGVLREQRALAVHHFEGADYLVIVFGVLVLNTTWGSEVICRGCLLCRMQERLAVSHDCFRVVPTLIEAHGYALYQEGFGVVQRPVCVWSTSALSKNRKVWWGLASGLCCLELAVAEL